MVSLNTNTTLSLTILALFFIVIMVGYVYVDESRKTSEEAKAAIEVVNATQAEFLKEWKHKQIVDNVRFNRTLDGLAATYHLIVGNQKLIINLSDTGSHNTQRNLNLTKFNRAMIVDSNRILRELADYLNFTNLKPFPIVNP
jgi:hypothetical protein